MVGWFIAGLIFSKKEEQILTVLLLINRCSVSFFFNKQHKKQSNMLPLPQSAYRQLIIISSQPGLSTDVSAVYRLVLSYRLPHVLTRGVWACFLIGSHTMPRWSHSQPNLSQSSQLAEPMWTDPGLKSGISVHKLLSTIWKKFKKFKAPAGNEWSNILQNSF